MRELPGAPSLPLVGDTLSFLKDPGTFFAQRTAALGNVFRARVLGDDLACFVGPEAFSFFLDERHFTRAKANAPHIEKILTPDAVPFLDGEAFKRRKALLMEIFKPSAVDGYLRVIETVLTRYLSRWKTMGTFDWVPELNAFAMSVAGALFVGADPATDDPELAAAFDRAFAGMLSVPVNLPFTTYGRALKACTFVRARIARALEEHQQAPRDDAMSQALAATTADGAKLSPAEIRTEMFHFFGAYVPVIGGLAYLAQALGTHRPVLEKVRAETASLTSPLTLAALRSVPYLDAVTKESRRVQPILPITFFARVKEECSFNDVRIPAGYKAVGCIGATLQDASVFPSPGEFNPERWLNASERERKAWVPHGGGAHHDTHRCAGELLADTMLKAFTVRLLREADFTLPPQDFSPEKGKLFAIPASGLRVELR